MCQTYFDVLNNNFSACVSSLKKIVLYELENN